MSRKPKPIINTTGPATFVIDTSGPTQVVKGISVTVYTCPNCNTHDCTYLSDLPSTDFAGVLPTGQMYTTVTRKRVQCKSCGQIGVMRGYINT